MWSACADFYHSSHACYGTHCRSGPPHPAQLCVVYLYLQIHSLTHVLTYSWRHGPLCLASLLGLGPAGLELATARLHTAPAARHPPPPCCARPPTADSCKKINSLTSGRNIDSERYCRVVRDSKNTLRATAPADSAETFTVRQRAARSILP